MRARKGRRGEEDEGGKGEWPQVTVKPRPLRALLYANGNYIVLI